MKTYTKTGDSGYTGLLGGDRTLKDDSRIKALGDLDELTSYLGLIKSRFGNQGFTEEIENIQRNLIVLMSGVAGGDKRLSEKEISALEALIDRYQSCFPQNHGFVLPGDSEISSVLDISRSVARRAERSLISADSQFKIDDNSKKYINRLSDYLYTLARFTDFKEKVRQKVIEVLKKDAHMQRTVSRLSLDVAKRLMERIEQKARDMELPVVVAVANEDGNIIAVHNMDGALAASYDIAVNKAYTSAAVKISTEELGKLAQPGGPLYGIQNTNNNRIVIFGGGCPLFSGEKIIGGLGVSGGTAEQDIELANFGASLLKEVLQ